MDKRFDSNPLHFEPLPAAGSPPDAELLGTGFLVAWCSQKGLLSAAHAKSAEGKQLAAREITGRQFLISRCSRTFGPSDVKPEAVSFLWSYTHRLFRPAGEWKAARPKDAIWYSHDFLATFKGVTKSPYLVPDSWAAFDRLAPLIDARWVDAKQSEFRKAPEPGLYEKAEALRNANRLVPVKVKATRVEAADDLTEKLLALVGKPLTDKAVKTTLTQAGLPIAKRAEQQALPALGVAYNVKKLGAPPKPSVTHLTFYRKGVKSYVAGLNAETVFNGYPNALPKGLTFADDRVTVLGKLGKPTKEYDGGDMWPLTVDGVAVELNVWFARSKIEHVTVSLPRPPK